MGWDGAGSLGNLEIWELNRVQETREVGNGRGGEKGGPEGNLVGGKEIKKETGRKAERDFGFRV